VFFSTQLLRCVRKVAKTTRGAKRPFVILFSALQTALQNITEMFWDMTRSILSPCKTL
jgi:hypothetical protein